MSKKSYLIDMDGVLVRGRTPIPGAQEFIARLIETETPFLILTNNPMYTPRDLQYRLETQGLKLPDGHLYTAAMATAQFLADQRPNGKAFAIGESGLTTALHDVGYVLTSVDPDYVVLGETNSYQFEEITRAIRMIVGGARFVATNPDTSGPTERGIQPACGAMAALIEAVTNVHPYFIGKPNPLMMRNALNFLGSHSEDTIMVGDRMDTDIIGGTEAGMETILVLTGVTNESDITRYSYLPTKIVPSVAHIEI